ncbi:retron Se72 family effector protein [Vreelandella zhanjiangensis]|uniref:retron Se72 family effector protein n=1 Tax=Vreelandella zhanjiangensis TaxID=1121960 RepID=UPI00402AE843
MTEKGFIHHYNQLKGFGFIRREYGKDIFFFFEDFIDGKMDIIIGENVEFEIRQEAKGLRAYQIKILG